VAVIGVRLESYRLSRRENPFRGVHNLSPLWVEPHGSIVVAGMAGIGAELPLRSRPAGGPSCPLIDLPVGPIQMPTSLLRRTSKLLLDS
jgi:hypothetical protein